MEALSIVLAIVATVGAGILTIGALAAVSDLFSVYATNKDQYGAKMYLAGVIGSGLLAFFIWASYVTTKAAGQ